MSLKIGCFWQILHRNGIAVADVVRPGTGKEGTG